MSKLNNIYTYIYIYIDRNGECIFNEKSDVFTMNTISDTSNMNAKFLIDILDNHVIYNLVYMF